MSSADYAERTIVTDDGVRLAVRDYGARGATLHTVVLLHGLCLTQESWALQVRLLTRRWGSAVRIISYDHRGHGGSAAAPMHTYRVERLAADLGDVLSALHVTGPLTLVGHSLGGMTALAYLSRPDLERPVQVAGLVLIATAAGRLSERGLGRVLATPATRVFFDLVQRMPQRATDQSIKAVTGPMRVALAGFAGTERLAGRGLAALAAESIRAASPATTAGFLRDLTEYDVSGSLASIGAKTIVISGGNDITTPAAHARDLATAIPGAMHLALPAAGHMVLLDAPHCVSSAINRVMGLRYGLPSSRTQLAA